MIVLAIVEEDEHAAVKSLAFLLLLLLFLGVLHSRLVASLLLLGKLVALLLAVALLFVVFLFQLNGKCNKDVNI